MPEFKHVGLKKSFVGKSEFAEKAAAYSDKMASLYKSLNGDIYALGRGYSPTHLTIIQGKDGVYLGTRTAMKRFDSDCFKAICTVAEFKAYCIDVKQDDVISTDYSKLSDYKLSKAILNVLYCDLETFPTTKSVSHCKAEIFNGNQMIGSAEFDINNPADIMPLVFERGINILNIGNGEYMACNGYLHHSMTVVDNNTDNDNTNPYRAMAITILMMEDNKK